MSELDPDCSGEVQAGEQLFSEALISIMCVKVKSLQMKSLMLSPVSPNQDLITGSALPEMES